MRAVRNSEKLEPSFTSVPSLEFKTKPPPKLTFTHKEKNQRSSSKQKDVKEQLIKTIITKTFTAMVNHVLNEFTETTWRQSIKLQNLLQTMPGCNSVWKNTNYLYFNILFGLNIMTFKSIDSQNTIISLFYVKLCDVTFPGHQSL